MECFCREEKELSDPEEKERPGLEEMGWSDPKEEEELFGVVLARGGEGDG